MTKWTSPRVEEIKAEIRSHIDNLVDVMKGTDDSQESCIFNRIEIAESHFKSWEQAVKELDDAEEDEMVWQIEQEEQAYRDAERRFGC